MNEIEQIFSLYTWAFYGAFVLFLALIGILLFRSKSKTKSLLDKTQSEEKKIEPEVLAETPVEKLSWTERLSLGLARSRQQVWGKISDILKGDQVDWDQIEEILYTADISPRIVSEILQFLKKQDKAFVSENFQQIIFDFLHQKMVPVQNQAPEDLFAFVKGSGLKVIMIVGVNGAGKTTTIGKLAIKLKNSGAKVLVGACDTFRAAAVDQLQVWCERAGVDMVRAQEGHDPSGVAFDTVTKAAQKGYDFCLIDTAGRLHTAQGLMEELAKTKRVMDKAHSGAPHHILLVLDAITGQNALRQADEFNQYLGLTGLIFTKCDGSAKAGSAVGIVDQLKVPLSYIGVGEGVDDLNHFELAPYLRALTGLKQESAKSLE